MEEQWPRAVVLQEAQGWCVWSMASAVGEQPEALELEHPRRAEQRRGAQKQCKEGSRVTSPSAPENLALWREPWEQGRKARWSGSSARVSGGSMTW